MGLGHYLFSFSGRVNRAKQWALLLVGLAIGIVVSVVFAFTIGFQTFVALGQHTTTMPAVMAMAQTKLFFAIAGLLYLLGFYISLAVTTKRLHDRNKSAWWLLIFILLPIALQIPSWLFLPTALQNMAAAIHAMQAHTAPPPPVSRPPLVTLSSGIGTLISLWAFIELYFFRGTDGDNRYGPDPLAGRG